MIVDAGAQEGPPVATVKSDGKKLISLDLSRDLEPTTVKTRQGDFVIEVKNNKIRVVRANTPRELCVKRGFIGPGEEVVCLPIRVVISVSGSAKNLPDVTSS